MEARDVIDRLRTDLQGLAQDGQQFVHLPSLLQWLREVEQDAPVAIQTRELQHQSNLAHYRAVHEGQLEMFRSVMETGKTALTTTILVNGGATAALLTFIGSAYSRTPPSVPVAALVTALAMFGCGVLAGVIATGTSYLCQMCYERKWRRTGIGFHIASVALVFGSYALFAAGIAAALQAFT